MLYFSKLRILFITLFSLLFILIASSNLFKVDDGFFDKKINLGLDLQGGSYLLLEIDSNPIVLQKLQNKFSDLKKFFREQNIKFQECKTMESLPQKDNYKCGYHSVFNMKKLEKF